MTIHEAVYNYNGRKRIKDIEIKHIKWFMRTQNLSLEEAVEAYFIDKEEEKRLSYKDYLKRCDEICKEIESHCEGCRYNKICAKNILLRHYYSLDDIKKIQRSECWKN